jgi:hypothetical protein
MVEEAVAEVQRRLASHKASKVLCVGVEKLKKDFSLSQHAELALRMLDKDSFAELLSAGKELKDKLSQVPDASALILKLTSALDPDIKGLIDAVAAADAEEEEEAWPEDDGDAPASATEYGRAKAGEITVTFHPGQPLGLSREIGTVVALKEGGQAALLGVEVGMRIAKVNGHWCASFDAATFQEAKNSAAPFRVTFTKAGSADPDPPGLAKGDAGSSPSLEAAMAETERRLLENKKTPHYFKIVSWGKLYKLAETTVLGLRMLRAEHLKEIFDNEDDFKEKFKTATVEKRNQIVSAITEALDPEVGKILKVIKAAEEEAAEAPASEEATKPWAAAYKKVETAPAKKTEIVPAKSVITPAKSVITLAKKTEIVPASVATKDKAAPKASSDVTDKFLQAVQTRLKQNKVRQGDKLVKEIERLRDTYSLPEEVEVTLRLLKPDDLRGLLETEQMLGGTPVEKKEAVELMVQTTDEEATAVATKLKTLQEQEEASDAAPEEASEEAQPQAEEPWPAWGKRSAPGAWEGESEQKKAKVNAWNGGGSSQANPMAQMAQMFAAMSSMAGGGKGWW